jgi:Domain of unknown function (DUF3841)
LTLSRKEGWDMVRVWMIAEATLYDRLKAERVLYVDPTLTDEDFGDAYAWMRGQMALHIPGYGGHWPWWAWVRPPCGCVRPDLRKRQLYHNGWPAGTACMRLELDVPDIELLLSDFDMWHAVLNNSPLVSSDEEWDTIEALPEPQQRSVKEATWPRLFALAEPPDPFWDGTDRQRTVQACFETLRLADVYAVTLFRTRPTRW